MSPLLVSLILTPSFIRYCFHVFAYPLQVLLNYCITSNESSDQSDRPMFYVPIIETNIGHFNELIVEFPPKLRHEVNMCYNLQLWLAYLSRGVFRTLLQSFHTM